MRFRTALAALLAALALLLQLGKLGGLYSERLLIVENGYPAPAGGFNVTLLPDYNFCYTAPFAPPNMTISVPLEQGEARGPLLSEGCLDLPPGLSFSVPLILFGNPVLNVPLREVLAREPGILQLDYEGYSMRITLLVSLLLQEIRGEVVGEGEYRLRLVLLNGESPVGEMSFSCSGSCAFQTRPATRVTAYDVYVIRDRLPIWAVDFLSLSLLLASSFLFLLREGKRLLPLR
ncbi:MAG: hypothetical protein NZ902_03675 [Acidilobaceae archaeon]|nr:hypothetical protein [Acidilobaceae archaeon]MCX8165171.1 hypothetical protein [Acidilobaceae archaeon]MDW7974313.1 hypothetical protein [Sulfolobales archaeon]